MCECRDFRNVPIDITHRVQQFGHLPSGIKNYAFYPIMPLKLVCMALGDVPGPCSYTVVSVPYEKHLSPEVSEFVISL